MDIIESPIRFWIALGCFVFYVIAFSIPILFRVRKGVVSPWWIAFLILSSVFLASLSAILAIGFFQHN